jgi:hypothetical protein
MTFLLTRNHHVEDLLVAKAFLGHYAARRTRCCCGNRNSFCVGCFTDQYPVPLMDFSKKT